MSSLSENRNRLKLFLLDEDEEQDEERSGLIHRLRNIESRTVSVVDIPAVEGANWRTVKNQSGEAGEQLALEGLEVSSMSNEELKRLVTDLEKDKDSESVTEGVAGSNDVGTDGNNEASSTLIERVYNHLDELSTQNNELESQNNLLRDEISVIRSQVDKNTESISTFSLNNNESGTSEAEPQVETQSELVEDETVMAMEEIIDIADDLSQTATGIRELKESGQISQEQSDKMNAEVESALESLELEATAIQARSYNG